MRQPLERGGGTLSLAFAMPAVRVVAAVTAADSQWRNAGRDLVRAINRR